MKRGLGLVFSGSVFSSICTSAPLPVFMIVPVCSGVPLPLHPFIQIKVRENGRRRDDAGRGDRRPFPSRGGKKTQMRKDTFEKRIFFSSAGSQRRV